VVSSDVIDAQDTNGTLRFSTSRTKKAKAKSGGSLSSSKEEEQEVDSATILSSSQGSRVLISSMTSLEV
jgi:hypothetical protein